jgi:predicted ATPase
MPFLKSFSIDTDKTNPFPFAIPAVRHARDIRVDERVTIFVGDNGSGKSTLLESIAYSIGLPLIGGLMGTSAGFEAARAIKPYLKLDWGRETLKGFFFRAEDFSDFIGAVDRQRSKIDMELHELKGQVNDSILRQMSDNMNYALRQTQKQYGGDLQAFSHGEAYLTILQTRITEKGVFLLDEPEAALSPVKQLALIAFILEVLKNNNTQFIIATHSPILMGIPGALLYEIREEEMQAVAYTETDHYRVTRRFLENPESYLRHFT